MNASRQLLVCIGENDLCPRYLLVLEPIVCIFTESSRVVSIQASLIPTRRVIHTSKWLPSLSPTSSGVILNRRYLRSARERRHHEPLYKVTLGLLSHVTAYVAKGVEARHE